MNAVISPSDRVLVRSYRATVIEWTPTGKLKADGNGKVIVISSEDAKKVVDKRKVEPP